LKTTYWPLRLEEPMQDEFSVFFTTIGFTIDILGLLYMLDQKLFWYIVESPKISAAFFGLFSIFLLPITILCFMLGVVIYGDPWISILIVSSWVFCIFFYQHPADKELAKM